MSKFFVDFEFAGHVKVDAENKESAMEIVRETDINKLLDNVQNFNVGKYYAREVTENKKKSINKEKQ